MSKSPEHDLQTRCVIWFHYRFPHLKPLFFSVPNGGYRKKAEAARLKAEGANAGVSDLILQLPAGKWSSLNIEMKAGSSQREEQKVYQTCVQVSGGRYELCRSYEQFVDLVTEYISQVDGRVLERLRQIHFEREEEEKQKIRKQYQKRISKTLKP